MKKKEKKNLKDLNMADLQKLLLEKRNKLVELKFNLAAGKVKNIREIRETKKEIARILTFINLKSKNKEE
jgi:large subunit ribosomal protein L29